MSEADQAKDEKIAELENAVKGLKQGIGAEKHKRQEQEAALTNLQGQLESLKKQPETKVYSRRELNQLVEEDRITQDEADGLFEKQLTDRITSQALETVSQATTVTNRDVAIQAEIAKYMDALPDLMEDGSEKRTAVEDEIRFVTQLNGREVTLETELMALRTLYGPAAKLVKSTSREMETTQEELSRDGSEAKPKDPSGLSPRELEFGNKQVSKGLYKDIDEYAKQVNKYGNSGIRKRANTRAA